MRRVTGCGKRSRGLSPGLKRRGFVRSMAGWSPLALARSKGAARGRTFLKVSFDSYEVSKVKKGCMDLHLGGSEEE